MIFKRFSRAGLLALAGAIVLAILLSLPTFHASFAETAAEAPAAARPRRRLRRQDPDELLAQFRRHRLDADLDGHRADDDHPGARAVLRRHGAQKECRRHGDDELCHHLPRSAFCGWSSPTALPSGRRTPFIGGLDRAFLQGIVSDISKGIGNPNPLAPTIPETVYSMFQLTFAIITAALIAGSFAERMKFSAMLWFIGLWAIFVYSPIAHWVWGPDGIFNAANDAAWVKVLDFAGGTVVHVNSGTAGLMAALMLGKRKDTAPPHNMVYTLIGASLLWVGWFGFNAGSAVSAGMQAGMAMLVTHTRHRDRRLHLDDRRVDHARQTDGDRHLLGRRGGSCRHHAGFRFRRPDGGVRDRHRRRHRLLLGRHRAQALLRL